jgi:hypothetical protein
VSRLAVAATCVVVLVVGFVAGKATRPAGSQTVTVRETVERPVVVLAQHVRSATDPRDRGPLDLARVTAVREGDVLRTTIVARRAWRDSLLRKGGARLSLLYDTNDDGKADRRDVVFLFHGRLTSWISTIGRQGVEYAPVARRSPTTIVVERPATVFYSASGEAGMLQTEPIGVTVVASWKGGGDRVPDRGWIVVPPPS